MTYKEFVRRVAFMRQAQRLYFTTKQPSILAESKKLECEVDKAIKDISNRQKRLFD